MDAYLALDLDAARGLERRPLALPHQQLVGGGGHLDAACMQKRGACWCQPAMPASVAVLGESGSASGATSCVSASVSIRVLD